MSRKAASIQASIATQSAGSSKEHGDRTLRGMASADVAAVSLRPGRTTASEQRRTGLAAHPSYLTSIVGTIKMQRNILGWGGEGGTKFGVEVQLIPEQGFGRVPPKSRHLRSDLHGDRQWTDSQGKPITLSHVRVGLIANAVRSNRIQDPKRDMRSQRDMRESARLKSFFGSGLLASTGSGSVT